MAESCNSGATLAVSSIIILICLFFNNLNLIPVAEAIWLTIPSTGTKCLSEEIQNNVVVLADYYVINEDRPEHTPTVSVRVTSPYGNNLHHVENVTHGQFAFTTTEAGSYMACFWLDTQEQHVETTTLSLDWKIGIAAKDWDSVARKEKIEGVELDLRRLEGAVEAIHNNLIYLKGSIEKRMESRLCKEGSRNEGS
ncbi:transmembrane emp24 domain-containing protein p24delta5 isoform X2 [Jatropha curcas]|uniref:transmembrane emp24 domain-containing protein p24delta5 isoform X2 n=1 Tax=Jatropha curcas TaxID=180498 RepID=UPI0018931C7C|nr:transmembrane emp24 domain-containing protein p24delta5 isoform X2 [Jatropha curcas]